MAKPYKNAAAVLPPELLAEVQKHHVGLLWVPKREDYYKERIRLVRELLSRGVDPVEVAEIAELSERRVRQVLKEVRSAS